jgi:hypothetical protein
MLGNGRLEAKCQDGETRLGQIRGQMRKKVSIAVVVCMTVIGGRLRSVVIVQGKGPCLDMRPRPRTVLAMRLNPPCHSHLRVKLFIRRC